MALFGTATNAFVVDLAPMECLNEGNTFILGVSSTDDFTQGFTPDFNTGFCCDQFADMNRYGQPTEDPDGACNTRCEGNNNAFCIGNPDSVTNRFLVNFLNPSDADNCAADGNFVSVTESDVPVETVYTFNGELPNADAEDWHCKWKITADPALLPHGLSGSAEDRALNGWLVVEATSTGFDKEVVFIMQPEGKYYDYNHRDSTNNALEQTFVGLSKNGNKYVFPAEYEIYLDVSPYEIRSNSDTQPAADGEGNIAFTVTHTLVNPTPEDADRSWSNVLREEIPVVTECVDDMTVVDLAGDNCSWYAASP